MTVGNKAPLVDRWLLLGEMMRDQELNDSCRRVGWAILDHVNSRSGDAWPSYDRLVTITGLSRAAVGRGVKMLLETGYFVHIQGGGNQLSQYPGDRKGRSNRYRPVFDKCPEIAARLQSTAADAKDRSAVPVANQPASSYVDARTFPRPLTENERRRIALGETSPVVTGPDYVIEDVF